MKRFFRRYLAAIISLILCIVIVHFALLAFLRPQYKFFHIFVLLTIAICFIIPIILRELKIKRSLKIMRQYKADSGDLLELSQALETDEMGLVMKQMLKRLDELESELHQRIQQQANFEKDMEAWTHDIKTPLASTALLLESNELDAEDIKLVRESLYVMDRRINQALYYAKVQNINSDLHVSLLDLESVIRKAIRDMAIFLAPRQVTVSIDISSPKVIADARWLEFIIQNLVENSAKYCGDNPHILFTSESSQTATYLFIIDNGPGITELERRQIFERGYRGKVGRTTGHSTGMGLTLSHEIAKRMGLDLSYIPSDISGEKGAVFRLTFPAEPLLKIKKSYHSKDS